MTWEQIGRSDMTIIAELMLTEALRKIETLEKSNKALKISGANSRNTIDSIMKTYREIFRMFEEYKQYKKENVELKADLRDSSVRNGKYLLDLSREKRYSDQLRWRLNEIESEKADADFDEEEEE